MGNVFRCPGSAEFVTPAPEERRCPRRGRAVEIWSDEQEATCVCGFVIHRDRVPSCVEWCLAAEKCLGGIVDVETLKKAAAESSLDAGEEAGAEAARAACLKVKAIAEHLAARRGPTRSGATGLPTGGG